MHSSCPVAAEPAPYLIREFIPALVLRAVKVAPRLGSGPEAGVLSIVERPQASACALFFISCHFDRRAERPGQLAVSGRNLSSFLLFHSSTLLPFYCTACCAH